MLLISSTGHNENDVSTRTKEKLDHNSLNLKSKDFIISVYVISHPSKISNFGQNDFIERTKLKLAKIDFYEIDSSELGSLEFGHN